MKAAEISGGRLPTKWSNLVSPTNALPEYPRPQMVRKEWLNLNGLWQFALTDQAETSQPTEYEGEILVPFPFESSLSGVARASVPDQRLWSRRTFDLPPAWLDGAVLLHFGAVNWDSVVFVNGQQVGTHRGGFDAFSFEVSSLLQAGTNEIVVSAWNPVDEAGAQVIGKQRLKSEAIWYTACTGIWQTVWLEPVPKTYISSLRITPDIDQGCVNVVVNVAGSPDAEVSLASANGLTVVGKAGESIRFDVPSPKLWSPSDPHLYPLNVSIDGDELDSYFAMRKISLGPDAAGRTSIVFNNEPMLQMGVLDQGYWPDGIYTAPTDDALRYDLEAARDLGFTVVRKHAKVEPDRWYYWADKLGLLVWQDMPQAYVDEPLPEARAQFITEMTRMIEGLYNHPSIVVWTPFNEGWGQHDTEAIAALTKQLDPSRLVDSASGWTDKGVGDFMDVHAYPGPGSEPWEPNRASVNGEFGGVTTRVTGRMWSTDVMGYGDVVKGQLNVTIRYQELLKAAYELREQFGTSAFIYTQLTDVEQESNGLLTYDRDIMKADPDLVKRANNGEFPAVPTDQ